MEPAHASRRFAFSLLELLIVIAIISLLMNLVVPSIQSARSSARKTACSNNLRQIGVAVIISHDTQGHYPTCGWGYGWVGDPDRGYGEKQPGGWVYNVLPYAEAGSLHDLPAGMKALSDEKRRATATMVSTPLSGWNCPERRNGGLLPSKDPYSPYNSESVTASARTDYCLNAGTRPCLPRTSSSAGVSSAGPASYDAFEEAHWQAEFDRLKNEQCNGIAAPASYFEQRHVTDGTSKTYLIGEKALEVEHYQSGHGGGDKYTLLAGANASNMRLADRLPMLDGDDPSAGSVWGGPHPAGFNMLFCDGSLRVISYDVSLAVHESHGRRDDGGSP